MFFGVRKTFWDTKSFLGIQTAFGGYQTLSGGFQKPFWVKCSLGDTEALGGDTKGLLVDTKSFLRTLSLSPPPQPHLIPSLPSSSLPPQSPKTHTQRHTHTHKDTHTKTHTKKTHSLKTHTDTQKHTQIQTHTRRPSVKAKDEQNWPAHDSLVTAEVVKMVGVHVILLCNIALICFIDPMLKACISPSSQIHQRELSHHGDCTRCVFPQRRYQYIGRLEAG